LQSRLVRNFINSLLYENKDRLIIVNNIKWLMIQCGSLKGGRMEKLGCR
jgi:hypothetical protein